MFKNWKVLVVGAGTMGHSIAGVFAANGFETRLYDKNPDQLEKAAGLIVSNFDTLVSIGDISQEDKERAIKLIKYTSSLEEAAQGVNFVSESIVEDPQVKKVLFDDLDRLCAPETILTSNTSALNIYEAVKVSHPERLLIAHWFNPPHIMPLVEVVKGDATSDETVDTVVSLMNSIGKTPVLVKKYIPGFIINRLSSAIAREAGYMIGQEWVTPEDIDKAVCTTFGPRFPFEGPLELFDYVGWDVAVAVSKFMFPHLCSNTDPMPLGVELCAQGRLGVKSGRGLKDYDQADTEKILSERNQKIIKMLKAIKEL